MIEFQDSGSSFYQLIQSRYPQLFLSPSEWPNKQTESPLSVPHGTTVLAIQYQEGVVMAGDRRATEGYSISERRIEKVYTVDRYSAVAIAGAAGPCMELCRLLRIELEHYEKLEGERLSCEGKANKLAQMIKGNLPMAMQGLVVLPIFASYDEIKKVGRIFKYDVAGGQYEEIEYCSIGSGGRDARGSLKKIFKKGMSEEAAVGAALEALYDAAEGDIATGGPDMIRNIYPIVKVISQKGVTDVAEDKIKTILEVIIRKVGEA